MAGHAEDIYTKHTASDDSHMQHYCCAAARTKFNRLVKEQAAKEAAAASKSLAERSPHAKEVKSAPSPGLLAMLSLTDIFLLLMEL